MSEKATWHEIGYHVAVILTLPIAILTLWHENGSAAEVASLQAYQDLDQKYIDFEKLCLQNVRLDCADQKLPKPPTPELSDEEKIQQTLVYNVLFTILQRAYTTYLSMDGTRRKDEWCGWDGYVDDFLSRPAFATIFRDNESGYNVSFQRYLDDKLDQYQRGVRGTTCSVTSADGETPMLTAFAVVVGVALVVLLSLIAEAVITNASTGPTYKRAMRFVVGGSLAVVVVFAAFVAMRLCRLGG